MEPDAGRQPADLRDYLRPIWARKWLILAIVAAVAGGTYAYFVNKPKEYTAETSIFVRGSELDQLLFGTTSASAGDDRNTLNQATLLTSRSTAHEVAERVGYRGDPAALLEQIEATPSDGADFVAIEATAESPRFAAELANAFADAFISLRARSLRNKIEAAQEVAARELANLGDDLANAGARATLQNRIRRLEVIQSLPTGSAEQVDPALPPTEPSAPKPVRNAIFGGVLGLLFGFAVAFGLERVDRRLKRIEDVDEVYDAPLLAAIPHSSKVKAEVEDGDAVLPDALREPFRALRTNLQLAELDGPLRSIVVTSAVGREGKSTIVRNLALAYREAGLRVAVLDSDFHHPSVAEMFSLDAKGTGLTEVLTGEQDLEDALRPVSVQVQGLQVLAQLKGAHEENGHGDPENLGSLSVLTTGAHPSNPSSVLASDRMRAVLDGLVAQHDLVLIDSPPLLAVSDAVPLLSAVNGTILVARVGMTSQDAARRVVELVRRVPNARLLGVVGNDLQERALGGYYYGYHEYGSPQK
jgi:Mrp family chromosome partitioning ATPase/capsular polysaccharide biosynthesis protein